MILHDFVFERSLLFLSSMNPTPGSQLGLLLYWFLIWLLIVFLQVSTKKKSLWCVHISLLFFSFLFLHFLIKIYFCALHFDFRTCFPFPKSTQLFLPSLPTQIHFLSPFLTFYPCSPFKNRQWKSKWSPEKWDRTR